ncbi:SRPBCC family protein [Rhodococcus sp. 7Tela_A2]
MLLTNTLDIDAAADDVFRLINDDVEKVATCVPGAAITGKDGDTFLGGVKVKVGPISASYSGTIRFLEIDRDARTLKLAAKGADSHGNGDAEAEVAITVEQVGNGSRLTLVTDLVISGKIVSFGKGAIVAVSNKVLQQFAVNLGAMLAGGQAVPAAASVPVTHTSHFTGAPQQFAAPGGGSVAGEFDALAMIPAPARKYGLVTAVFLAGMVEGWLVTRAFRRR